MIIIKNKFEYVDILETLDSAQEYIFEGNEKEYEEYVFENLNEICGYLDLPKIREIKRQQRFNPRSFSIKPDLIVYHEDETVSVFEIKCSNPKYPASGVTEQTRAIGQLLLYKNVLEEMLNTKVRVHLIDQKIHKRTFFVFAGMKLPISLIEIQNDRLFIPYNFAG